MKLVMSNGKEYTIPNDNGIETLMATILKHYGYAEETPTETAKTENDTLPTAVGEGCDREFAFFNAEGDNITNEVFNNSERPRIKAIYVSKYDTEMWNGIRTVVPSFTYNGTDGVISGGLYVWHYDTWQLMSTKELEYFEYMAKSYDCAVNAIHHLKTVHNIDPLVQADNHNGSPSLS